MNLRLIDRLLDASIPRVLFSKSAQRGYATENYLFADLFDVHACRICTQVSTFHGPFFKNFVLFISSSC